MRTLSAKIIAIQVFFLVVALLSIGVTLLVSWELEGGAAAINDAGSLRMRAYRLAFLLGQPAGDGQIGKEIGRDILAFEGVLMTLKQGDPGRPLFLPKDVEVDRLVSAVEARWSRLRGAAMRFPADEAVGKQEIAGFVGEIDALVTRIEHDISGTTNLLHLFQLGLVALAIAGTIGIIYLSFLFIIGPVQRLHDGMARMAQADFNVRLPVDSRDEFGQLTRGFNDMAGRLRDLYQNLETKVAEKTQTLAARNSDLTLLYDTTAFLSGAQTVEALCQGFLARITLALGADAGAVRFHGSDTSPLHLYSATGLDDSFVLDEQCVPMGSCACGKAAQGAQPIHWGNLAHAPIEMEGCRKQHMHAVSAIPIRARNETIGIFNLFFKSPRDLTEQEEKLLVTLGQHLGSAVESQRLVVREKEMAVSEERNLIAQELHDSIAQSLAFLNLQVQMLDGALHQHDQSAAQAATHEIEAGVKECYADVRELLVHFRTRTEHEDISRALRLTLKKFEQQTGIEVVFTETGEAMPVPADRQVQVLHIIQEALSNVRKHAGANLVQVAMERGPLYRFVVADNGRGMLHDVAADTELHVGMNIMQERARRAGAGLRISSSTGQGTRVELTLAVAALPQAA